MRDLQSLALLLGYGTNKKNGHSIGKESMGDKDIFTHIDWHRKRVMLLLMKIESNGEIMVIDIDAIASPNVCANVVHLCERNGLALKRFALAMEMPESNINALLEGTLYFEGTMVCAAAQILRTNVSELWMKPKH